MENNTLKIGMSVKILQPGGFVSETSARMDCGEGFQIQETWIDTKIKDILRDEDGPLIITEDYATEGSFCVDEFLLRDGEWKDGILHLKTVVD